MSKTRRRKSTAKTPSKSPAKTPARKKAAPPRPQRDLVYRHYTKAELDAQYNQAVLGADLGPYIEFWEGETARAREAIPCHLDVPYGRKEIEKLDIYLPKTALRKPAPVIFFMRGGAWRMLSKDSAANAASMFAARRAIFVTPNFGTAPETSLAAMVQQVRRAFTWTWKNITDYGGDPDKLVVAGHSSGAHLAGTLLADGWRKGAKLPEDAIKGGVLFSGAYDLEPVRLSARNEYLNLTPAMARKLSPTHHVPRRGPPLFVAIAEGDLHEFRRQGHALAAAWKKRRNPVEFADVPDANHFDMADLFGDPKSPHAKAALKMLDGLR